jgi:hypothetical protein
MQVENYVTALALRARRLRFVTSAAILLVLAIMSFAVYASVAGMTDPTLPVSFALGVTNSYFRWAGLAVVLLTGAPFAYALWRLTRMMRCAERGEIFSSAAAAHLRAFALWVFVAAVASILLPVVLNISLGLLQGFPAERLRVDFDGSDLFILLVSGLLFFVARLIEAAQAIADDNRRIV